MSDNEIVLTFTKKECVPDHTDIYMTEDSLLYYWKYTAPMTLHSKWLGRDIKLPSVKIEGVCVYGDKIYLNSDKKKGEKIQCRAELFKIRSLSERILCEANNQLDYLASWVLSIIYKAKREGGFKLLRDKLENEKVTSAFCERIRYGRKQVYRMCDNPEKDGILIDVSDEQLRGMEPACVHMDMAIYKFQTSQCSPSVRKLSINVIAVSGNHVEICTGPSRFILIKYNDNNLSAVNIETLDILPTMRIEDVDFIFDIVGIHRGEITVKGKERTDFDVSLISARIPVEYYEMTAQVSANTNVIEDDDDYNIEGFEELIEQCCCSICSNSFDAIKFIPRNLECGHSFCEVCIVNKMRFGNEVKCPICSVVTILPDGKTLPKNFAIIGMVEQLMMSRTDPKITCKSCKSKFSSSAVRMCIKEDCDMYNQLICLSCALDGEHGGHVVKYDVKLEKIREKLHNDVTNLNGQLEEKKNLVLEKAKQLSKMITALEHNLVEANIPTQIIDQIKTISSEQDANELKDIVDNLSKTLTDECDTLSEAFDKVLNSATGLDLFDDQLDEQASEAESE